MLAKSSEVGVVDFVGFHGVLQAVVVDQANLGMDLRDFNDHHRSRSEIDQPSGITAPDRNGNGGERVPKVIGVSNTSLLAAED